VTIQIPDGGPPFEAALVEDEFHMVWLQRDEQPPAAYGFGGLLSAALKIGWRIVRASPEEQALLDAHGFGSGRNAVIAVVYRPPAMTADDYKASWEEGGLSPRYPV
jgi:hypothetical protein